MINAFISGSKNFINLSSEEKRLLEESVVEVRDFEKGEVINNEDDRPEFVHIMVEGWAYRYTYLEQGERAVLGYLIPGDVSDVHITLLDHMDHSVAALTPARIARIPREVIRKLFETHTSICYAFFWSSLLSESILRAWYVNNTARSADKRLAHLMCEMLARHQVSGLDAGDSFYFPVSQTELADAIGITPVHVNRVVQKLRKEAMIEWDRKHLFVLDWERLKVFSGFSPNYLHLSEEYLRKIST